jgi:uncharacterized paraquat-inducible protein A
MTRQRGTLLEIPSMMVRQGIDSLDTLVTVTKAAIGTASCLATSHACIGVLQDVSYRRLRRFLNDLKPAALRMKPFAGMC